MIRTAMVLVLVAALAAPVAAQPSVTPEQKAKAEEFFRAGERAFKEGQYSIAAQALEEALKIYPVPPIVFSTAQAYRLQYFADKDPGWLKRSIELYRRYISEVKSGGRRDDAVANLADLEPIMARIEAETRAPIEMKKMGESTQLMVSTNVEGAVTFIDGQRASLRGVEPGEHVVRAQAPGYFPIEEKRTAVEGRLVIAELNLKARPAVLRLRTEGGARASVDGRPVGQSLSRPIELPAGKHLVSVTRRGRYAWMREVTIKRGQKLELKAPLRTTTQRKMAWIVLGTSVVAFGAAGFTGFQALRADSKASDLHDKITTVGGTEEDLDEYERQKARRGDKIDQTLLFAGAGAAIATTGLLMILFDNPSAEAPMSAPMTAGVRASVTPGGLVVSGRF